MPKFFKNAPELIVDEALAGLVSLHPHLALLDAGEDIRVVVDAEWDRMGGRVAVISGGGSGHEPAHAGFVGDGMLTAAVCGQIFASPSVDAILAAIVAVTGPAGALLLVKNYTGDRLNFGLAAERAKGLGLKVELVIIDDDVAIDNAPQPRGLAGTIFIHKVAGAASRAGLSLEEVSKIASSAVSRLATLGVAMTTATLPTMAHVPRINDGDIELGLGIHGEPGAEIVALEDIDSLVHTMLKRLGQRFKLTENTTERFALLINNLGGTSPLELSVIAHAVFQHPFAKFIDLVVGPHAYVTSLDMKGFSLSLFQLTEEDAARITEQVVPSAWDRAFKFDYEKVKITPKLKFDEVDALFVSRSSSKLDGEDGRALRGDSDQLLFEKQEKLLKQITECLIACEDKLNRLDAQVGDGDTGTTFATAGKRVASVIPQLAALPTKLLLAEVGELLSRQIGGSSGVLFSILFTATANAYTQPDALGDALLTGLTAVKHYGGADRGNRTFIDALEPAAEAMRDRKSWDEVVAAARQGGNATAQMERAAGRSSYLRSEALLGHNDPGAEGIALVFETI